MSIAYFKEVYGKQRESALSAFANGVGVNCNYNSYDSAVQKMPGAFVKWYELKCNLKIAY